MHRTMIAILGLVMIFGSACVSSPSAVSEYRLVWADEFDRDGAPDPVRWTYETGFVRNQELQWYRPENAVCRDGCLVIEGRRERLPNPGFRPLGRHWQSQREFAEYTSACLTTKGRQAWLYGRFEVRARFPARDGLWPAIWFLGVSGRWPSCGEIDLMEYYQGHLLANACWGPGTNGKAIWNTGKKPLNLFGGPEWDQAFHVWRMDWDPDGIRLYVDGRLFNTIDVEKAANPEGQEPVHPFRQPQYLLLNLAIGGTSGGDPSHTGFPVRYEIDYVRVYQREAPGEAPVARH